MFFLSRQTVSRHRSLYAGSFVALAVGVFLLGLAATATAATIAYDAPPGTTIAVHLPGGDGTAPQTVHVNPTGEDVSGLQVVLSMVGTISGFITIFVIASTFAFAVASRRREIGLLRLIGAWSFRISTGRWRYVSTVDVVQLVIAAVSATLSSVRAASRSANEVISK